MSIYSNDNISKIAKLTTRELPHLAKTANITVRENNGVYSILMYNNSMLQKGNVITSEITAVKIWMLLLTSIDWK